MNSPVRSSRFTRANSGRIGVSFEFFPPNSEEMEQDLWESIERLAPLAPDFVSVTYGAGGSTRERTHATVKRILARNAIDPGRASRPASPPRARKSMRSCATYHAAGVRHIVALRGDPDERRGRKICAASRRLQQCGRSRRRHQAHRLRFRDFSLGLSGEASRQPDGRGRHRYAQGQGRRRRDPRDYPVLLRERPLFPVSRSRARARHRYPDRARHPAGAELQGGHQLCRSAAAHRCRLDRRALSGSR